MSRIGKNPIEIPQGVTASFSDDRVLTIEGKHGALSRQVRPEVDITVEENSVQVSPRSKEIFARSLWGTYASHVRNMITGVTERFEKKLVVEGVGYKVEVSGSTLTLTVGFSHPVNMEIPDGLEVSVEKNVITIVGADKELVGSFAAQIRNTKKPEPYKGKGIRYHDEVVRRKQGKKSA